MTFRYTFFFVLLLLVSYVSIMADPYDSLGMLKHLPDPGQPGFSLKDSSIVVWDTHFGEFEHKIRLEKLLDNPCFRLLDVHSPEIDKKFFTGRQYMSAIFRKLPCQNQEDQWITINSDEIQLASLNRVSSAVVLARARVLYDKEQDPDHIVLALAVLDEQKEMKRYLTINGSYFRSTPGQWFEMSLLTQVSTIVPVNGSIKLSVVGEGDRQVMVSDLHLDVLSVKK